MKKGWELHQKIKLAKARKLYQRNHMTEEQAKRRSELDRKIRFLDSYKLTPIKDMLDALKLEEKTLAKCIIQCAGMQVTLNVEQSRSILLEAHRCLMIERQQYISELEHL